MNVKSCVISLRCTKNFCAHIKETVKCLNFKWSWLWECFVHCLNANNTIRKTKVRISCTIIYFPHILMPKPTRFFRPTNNYKKGCSWMIYYIPSLLYLSYKPDWFQTNAFLIFKEEKNVGVYMQNTFCWIITYHHKMETIDTKRQQTVAKCARNELPPLFVWHWFEKWYRV